MQILSFSASQSPTPLLTKYPTKGTMLSFKTIGNKIGVNFNLTFHSARHSFAVYAIKKGINIYLLSKLLGHASIAVTEKIYAEFLPEEIEKVVRSTMSFDFAQPQNEQANKDEKEKN